MIKKSGLFTFLLTAVFAVNANAISSETNGVEILPNLAMATKSYGQNLNTQSSVSDFFKLDNELAIEGNGVIPAKLPTEIKSVSENNVTGTDKTAVTDLDKHKTPKFTDNRKTTAKSATAVLSAPKNTVTKKKRDLKKSDLPLIKENLQEKIVSLDNASLLKKHGNKTENTESNIKCSSKLPCIPMFNRYVLKLDENDAVKPEKEPNIQISKANQPKFESDKIYTNLATNALPPLGQVRFNNIPLDNEILTKKTVSKDPYENKAVFKPSYLSDSPLVAKLFEQGVIIGDITSSRPKIEKNADAPESLKNKSTDELINEQQRLYKILGVTGNFVRSYSEAKDKAEFIKSLGLSKVNGVLDSHINEYLKAYDGVNAEISSRLSVSKGNWKLQPEGKLLVPLWSKPKSFTYMQTRLTTGTSDRKIAHLGLGERIYPQAKSIEDLGHHMVGFNIVVDKDLSRGHVRGSLGVEYMHDNLKLISNIYKHLTSWKDSPDFEKGYVEERPASGWDLFVEYWLKAKLAIKAGVTHWIGKDVSPFGDTDEKNLENNPYIYEVGLKYNPVPAITLEAKHQHSNHGNNNSYVGINFNIPLGDNFSFENAFNPDAINKASGSNIMTSRSMFIERDYTMPLRYRSKPGKYYIQFVNQPGPNKYLFLVSDGFKRPAPFIPVNIKPTHPSIKFTNNGNYISDSTGHFVAEIISSAVPKDTITVCAGTVCVSFEIEIQNLSFKMKAEPQKFERFETSNVTIYIESDALDAIAGQPVKWRLATGHKGSLTVTDNTIQPDGTAKVIYTPDTTINDPYKATVIATVNGVDFSIDLQITIYGAGETDFSIDRNVIDGGEFAIASYSNLKPQSEIEFKAIGPCQLEALKPEAALPAKGTDATGQTVKITANDEGIATAFIVGSTVVGDTGNCEVTTKTPDPYLVAPNAKGTVLNKVYDPSWEVPSQVLYLEPFTATLTKLKNNTSVIFSAENDTSSVQPLSSFISRSRSIASSRTPGRALLRLARSPNNANAENIVTVKDNKASSKYLVTGDYTIQYVDGIKAEYYHDSYNTRVDTTASTLAITQFTPEFFIDDENQKKLDIFSGDDEFKVKLISGQPNRAIKIVNPENNVIIIAPDTFNSSGEAEITIKGKDIRSTENFTIQALALGKECSLSAAVAGGTLQYHIFTPNIVSFATNGGSNVYPGLENASYNGLPSFKGSASTIDYKTSYRFNIAGLRPDRTVSIKADNAIASLLNTTVDENGCIQGEISEIRDFDVKNVKLTLSYTKTSTEASRTTEDIDLNLYNYTLSIRIKDGYSNEIVGDGTTVVETVGGKPGETVAWSITGSGKILDGKSTTFDAQGNAYATVQGIAPFTDTVNLSASSLQQQVNHSLHLKLFGISVTTTRSGGDEGAGGILAYISGLKPNSPYTITVETTFHIYLYINGGKYAWWQSSDPFGISGDWKFYDQSGNIHNGVPSSFTYRLNSDGQGKFNIYGFLCNAEDHRYYTSMRFTITWKEQNVSQTTDWYKAW